MLPAQDLYMTFHCKCMLATRPDKLALVIGAEVFSKMLIIQTVPHVSCLETVRCSGGKA
ncbi:MAG: hypothetical protein ACLSCV_07775 [Acutalibacteraceae bacterium]